MWRSDKSLPQQVWDIRFWLDQHQRLRDRALFDLAIAKELKDEFDVLHAEGATRRRMMSLSTHDRLAGTPGMVHALEDFITYAIKHPGFAFMRKDAIARWALSRPDTPRNPPRTFDQQHAISAPPNDRFRGTRISI